MNDKASVPEIFGDLVEQLSTLFRKEVQLAKAETSEKVHQMSGAVVYMAIGGVILLAALLVLLDSIVAWLVVLGIEVQWSTLIVAVVVGIIGYVLLKKGMNDLKVGNLAPKRTMSQLQRDAQTAKEQVR